MDKIRKTGDSNIYEDMEELGSSYTINGNGRWYKLLWKAVFSFLKKLNIHLPYDLSVSLLEMYLREIKQYVHANTCMHMFTAFICIYNKYKYK